MEVVTEKRLSVGHLMGHVSPKKDNKENEKSRRDTHKGSINSIRMTPNIVQAENELELKYPTEQREITNM